ncbi:MAG TPA: chemotaxis protein CheX [Myxococcota bacterium]|nr:chemotaxis protein CheX [Myxococcota bacterium]HRY91866.1 chemotaxis protein CheX [Myxococcota bacterium]HSA23068.1 chemotaxis protein CheX [Myxococcota bacterium]
MGIQFFGEFLLDRWVITRGQLLEALELQEYRNLKFGVLAVQKGFLRADQVEAINDFQRGTDRRFGDLALEKGWMNPEQVREIITLQKNNYLYLGEALLELGHLTEDVLERELAIFKEEQSRYNLEAVPVPPGVPVAGLIAACVDLTRKLMLRVAGMLAKTGEPALVAPGAPDVSRELEFHLTIAVPLGARPAVRYVLSVSSDVAVTIATRILKEDATRESEEVVEDAVREFCNIVCGNAVAKMSQQGMEVELGPPESLEGIPELGAGMSAVSYPLKVSGGEADLRFVILPA